MNILLDSKGLQSHFHLGNKQRLSALIAEVNLKGHSISFSRNRYIQQDELNKTDVLVITTRHPQYPFSSDGSEIRIIHEFINNGGGLLLMSNHGPSFTRKGLDFTIEDSKLVKGFGIEIENTFFANSLGSLPTVIRSENLNTDHSIFSVDISNTINSIVTNTTCSIKSDYGETIASLPANLVDISSRRKTPPTMNQKFALSLDLASENQFNGSGRIIVVADSGFVGSDNTLQPGPGQISKGNNIAFILNSLEWLSSR